MFKVIHVLHCFPTLSDVVSYLFVFCALIVYVSGQCKPIKGNFESCRCQAEDFTVDLHEILDEIGETPRFKDIAVSGSRASSDTSRYSYQPCIGFKESLGCDNVAACQKISDDQYQDIGDPPTALTLDTFYTGDPREQQLNLTYVGFDGRKSIVMLRCGKTSQAQLLALGETEKGSKQYEFELSTRYACYNGDSGPTTGTIMLIVFFLLLATYLIGGMLYMRFSQGARGVEQIPNLEFWRGLPGAAKDGFLFVIGGCKADTTYSQI